MKGETLMDAVKNAYYRTYQFFFDIGARFLNWRKPITVTGEGSLAKAPELFKKNGVKKVMIVTGRTVGKTIAPVAKAALDKAGIAYEHYSEVSANPTVTVVNEIQKLYLETGCDGFLAIGPGTLYALLGDFEQEGVIHCIGAEGKRKIYRISELGRGLYAEELNRLKRCISDAEGGDDNE